jgi:2,4-dienoyl-CoA reductase-like NADH-dependent reductase (Old Yellow Enzyme family)
MARMTASPMIFTWFISDASRSAAPVLFSSKRTAVTEQGRITAGCNGLWLDAQIPQLKRITDFLHRFGSAAGMQLAHSGWKGSTRRPWHGGTRLDDEDVKLRGEHSWPIVSVGDESFDGEMPGPAALTESDLSALLESYRAATRRALAAGFDVVDVHAAHGYLLHSFLSPLSNTRDDRYGGSIGNRMRFPLAVVEAVRTEWPADKPLFVRISSVDGIDVGWTIEDSVKFAEALAARGVRAVSLMSVILISLWVWREASARAPPKEARGRLIAIFVC